MVRNPGGGSRTASPQTLFEEAVALHKRGDHKSAIERYKTLIGLEPDHPQILNMRATATAELGDLPEAATLLEMIEKAVRDYQDPHRADPSHPFLAQQPARWSYDIWATVRGSQGYQAPRISIAFDIVPLA